MVKSIKLMVLIFAGMFLYSCSNSGSNSDLVLDNNEMVIPSKNLDFSYEIDKSGQVTFTVILSSDDLKSDSSLSYLWALGDGNIYKTSQMTYTYSYENSGTYNVSLTVASSNGNTYSTSKTIEVDFSKITCKISHTINVDKVNFGASLSGITSSDIITYNWSFGGIVNETNQYNVKSPSVTYSNSGTYIVSLTVNVNGIDYKAEKIVISINKKKEEYVKIYAGNQSSFVETQDGLYGWGNSSSNLGTGTNNSFVSSPEEVKLNLGNDKIVDFKFMDSSYFCLTSSGRVYSWGANGSGQLGLSHKNNVTAPQLVQGNIKDKFIEKLMTVGGAVFVVDNESNIYSWGNNDKGQLGLGNKDNQTSPQVISELSGKKVLDITSNSGTIMFAVTSNGELYSWGSNFLNLLGRNVTEDYDAVPKRVTDNILDKSITKVITSSNIVFIMTDNGEVYGWGENYAGQVGAGHNKECNTPQKVVGSLKDKSVVDLKIHKGATLLAVDKEGKIYSWGENGEYILGRDDVASGEARQSPEAIPALSDKVIKSIYLSEESAFAVDSNGKVYAWGRNILGQMGAGLGYDGSSYRAVPAELQIGSNGVYSIIPSKSTVFAVGKDGYLYGWGDNQKGQIGLGDKQNRDTPTKISTFKVDENSSVVWNNLFSTFVTTADGKVYSFGNNMAGTSKGILGTGNTADEIVPTPNMVTVPGGL